MPQPLAHQELEPGAVFTDRYEIEAVLGRGGMGAVYRARDRALGESIALKILASGDEASVSEVMRFRQEVKLARRVTHPNVARVYDIGEHEGIIYLTMELVAGETLRQLLRREGALGVARATRVALALCDGLRAAHAAGVVHRDLKPANVLLDGDGRVVITDFGIARSLEETSGLTVGVVGTPSYMAPEQLFSGAIDGRTDLYALGLLLHEMATGRKPGGDGLDPSLPAPFAELVRRCTAPLADARPASVDEVALALARLDTSTPAPSPSASPPSRDPVTRPERPSPLTYGTSAPTAILLPSTAPSLAVLPFRYRGPPEHDYFGEALAEELVDILARTRGLRVLGSAATARFHDARDPRALGADLHAAAVVDGSLQLTGERMRLTVRLLETETAVQLWSERYDGGLGDLIELQEGIARRIAEELRVELTTLRHRGAAPAAAIEHYLAGRHQLRAYDHVGALAGATGLDRCLALAPDFAPALAARAIAHLRCWFYDLEGGETDWESTARGSVAVALDRAPELAETHLAAAVLATHSGDYRAAVRALGGALSIAPTYADAHEYLAMLECEAGRAEEGARRFRLAASLDPSLMYCGVFQAREHALHGRLAECDATLDELDRRHGRAVAQLTAAQRVRVAAWRGDHEALRRLSTWEGHDGTPHWRIVQLYARALIGELSPHELREGLTQLFSATHNPRFLSLAEQLATEIHAGLGQLDEARLHLSRAATSVLVDLEWMDRCPLLAPLRALPDWPEVRRRVKVRAEMVWA